MAGESLRLAVVVHSETSTATVTDIQAICELTRDRTCLLAIDAVSSLGAVPIETDAWGIDVLVSGSQKGMSTPPGLSFASVSPRGLERSRETQTPRFYFDWKRTLRRPERRRQPLHARDARPSMRSTSRSTWCSRRGWRPSGSARERSRAASAPGSLAEGLELYSPDDESCSLVTGVLVPEGADAASCAARCSPAGYIIEGGRGRTAGKVLRFGTSVRPTRRR